MTSDDIDKALAVTVAAPRTEFASAPIRTTMVVSKTQPSSVQEQQWLSANESVMAEAGLYGQRGAALRSKQESERLTLEPRIAPKLLAALRTHRTPCALFLGPTGCGKTSAARWVMAAHSCHLIRARDLASSSKRHGLGDGYPPEIERCRERGVLVIDDVGSEGSEVAALQDVLDHRYSRCYPTLVTSGLTVGELQHHLGVAYYRRIVDQHVLRNDGTEFPVLVVDCHEADR